MDNHLRPPVGILGGTFDPIHYGHLRIAEEISEIAGLQQMRFIPAGLPRLRSAPVATGHRIEMIRRAIDNNVKFVLDEREVKRKGVSYTVESLHELRQESGQDAILCFVIGADAFMRLAEWYEWRQLFQLCHFVIAGRSGYSLNANRGHLSPELEKECAKRWVESAESLKQIPSGAIFVAQTTLLDISATTIRRHVAAGKSIRYLVPDAIRDYIAANRLYRGEG